MNIWVTTDVWTIWVSPGLLALSLFSLAALLPQCLYTSKQTSFTHTHTHRFACIYQHLTWNCFISISCFPNLVRSSSTYNKKNMCIYPSSVIYPDLGPHSPFSMSGVFPRAFVLEILSDLLSPKRLRDCLRLDLILFLTGNFTRQLCAVHFCLWDWQI